MISFELRASFQATTLFVESSSGRQSFFSQDQNSLTGPQIRAAWTVFAEAYQADASQAKLHCRRFSVASFLNCLNYNAEFAPCIVDAGPDAT